MSKGIAIGTEAAGNLITKVSIECHYRDVKLM